MVRDNSLQPLPITLPSCSNFKFFLFVLLFVLLLLLFLHFLLLLELFESELSEFEFNSIQRFLSSLKKRLYADNGRFGIFLDRFFLLIAFEFLLLLLLGLLEEA